VGWPVTRADVCGDGRGQVVEGVGVVGVPMREDDAAHALHGDSCCLELAVDALRWLELEAQQVLVDELIARVAGRVGEAEGRLRQPCVDEPYTFGVHDSVDGHRHPLGPLLVGQDAQNARRVGA
jgi:hypothetical protein